MVASGDAHRDASFALVLLYALEATHWVEQPLGNPTTPTGEIVWALHAAAAMGRLEPKELPS